jgi:hypothetical protein
MGELYRRLATEATPSAISGHLHQERGSFPTSAPSPPFCAMLAVLAQAREVRESDWKARADVAWSTVNFIGERMVAMGVATREVVRTKPKYGIIPQRRVTFAITELGHDLVAELVAEGALPPESGSTS